MDGKNKGMPKAMMAEKKELDKEHREVRRRQSPGRRHA
jgi:hypothetical protein